MTESLDLAELKRLAERPPGHCNDDAVWAEMVERYTGPRSALWATDFEVAYETAMIGRGDLNFEGKLGTAKDRIRWLSVQLAIALTKLEAAERLAEELKNTCWLLKALDHQYIHNSTLGEEIWLSLGADNIVNRASTALHAYTGSQGR